MVLRLRNEIPMTTTIAVISIALTGSPLLEILEIKAPLGIILFSPKADKILGAPTKEPKAEDNVAPSKPANTIGGKSDFSINIL